MSPDPTPGLPSSVSLSLCHPAGLDGSFCAFCSATRLLNFRSGPFHSHFFSIPTCPPILMGKCFPSAEQLSPLASQSHSRALSQKAPGMHTWAESGPGRSVFLTWHPRRDSFRTLHPLEPVL